MAKKLPSARRKCSRRGCKMTVKPPYIMCVKCWYSVPKEIREEVWASRTKDRKQKIIAVRRAIESLPPKEAA